MLRTYYGREDFQLSENVLCGRRSLTTRSVLPNTFMTIDPRNLLISRERVLTPAIVGCSVLFRGRELP